MPAIDLPAVPSYVADGADGNAIVVTRAGYKVAVRLFCVDHAARR
jgi:hypothetical protein